MGVEPPTVTPDYFQILVLRELRKVGFDVGQPRISRRSELPEPQRGFVLDLVIPLGSQGTTRRVLVVCRRQDDSIARDIIEAARARLTEASADAAIMFTTSGFAPDALAAAHDAGIALLQIVDGRRVFAESGWGDGTAGGDHYPAWLPAHLAQVVDRDPAGQPRLRVLEAGHPEMILDVIGSRTDE